MSLNPRYHKPSILHINPDLIRLYPRCLKHLISEFYPVRLVQYRIFHCRVFLQFLRTYLSVRYKHCAVYTACKCHIVCHYDDGYTKLFVQLMKQLIDCISSPCIHGLFASATAIAARCCSPPDS